MPRCAIWILLLAYAAQAEVFDYGAEWRLMRAGWARLSWHPNQAQLYVETTGFVGTLYHVKDDYKVNYNDGFCASGSVMHAEEGSKRRHITVKFNDPPGKAERVERDLKEDEVVETKQIDVPSCVHDVVAGLARLRNMPLKPARIEVQKRERVKTPAGEFDTMKLEAFLYNGVLYKRNAHLYVWLTNDARRVPVQIQVKMSFFVGTVTLQLEKEWDQ
jgi:hypothetical protein